jgi:hypothetical protein
MAQEHSQQWLMSMKSRESEAYLVQNCELMEEIRRLGYIKFEKSV